MAHRRPGHRGRTQRDGNDAAGIIHGGLGEWLERHPETLVLSFDTGFERPYGQDPFGGFRDRVNTGQRPFPDAEASRDDERLDDGEEVLGLVLDGLARAYPLRQLGDSVVNDELSDVPLVVIVEPRAQRAWFSTVASMAKPSPL